VIPALLLLLVGLQDPLPRPRARTHSLEGDHVTVLVMSRDEAQRLDPAKLPHAPEGRWKDFDPASIKDRHTVALLDTAGRNIRLGDFPGALGALLTLLRSEPDFPPALHMSAVVYYRLQRYGDSAVQMQRYLEIAPQRVGDTRVLGHDLYTLGRYTEARAHYDKVLAASPDDVEARRGLALTLWRLGDAPKAVNELDVVLARAPDNDEAWGWKAQILFDQGDDDAALAAAQRARELDPTDPRTWYLLSRIHAEQGRDEESTRAQARFTELSGLVQELRAAERRYLERPYEIARAVAVLDLQLRLGDPRRIRTGLDQLRGWGSEACVARRAVLEALVRLGRAQEALSEARTLRECAGDDADAWRVLESYFTAIGDPVNAARAADRRRALVSPR
jgi:tetratricopeptide (TPR) repeat protein